MRNDLATGLITSVLEERTRQDDLWGEATERGYTRGEWLTILVEEVGEVAKALNDGDITQLKTELIQVAAVALAFSEAETQKSQLIPDA